MVKTFHLRRNKASTDQAGAVVCMQQASRNAWHLECQRHDLPGFGRNRRYPDERSNKPLQREHVLVTRKSAATPQSQTTDYQHS